MPYKFEQSESIAAGVVRIESEQIDAAIKCLTSKGDIDTNIHSARKSLKRLRALVHLTKSHGNVKKEQKYFRTAGHELSQWRESAVLRKTVQNFRKATAQDPHMEALWTRVLIALDAEVPSTRKSRDGIKASARRAIRLLRKAKKIDQAFADDAGYPSLLTGLDRTYRQSRQLYKHLRKHDDVEVSHRLRRRVKYLWYDMQLLENATGTLADFRKDLGVLGELLGDEHDLVDLRRHLTTLSSAALSLSDLIDLSAAISDRRAEIHDQAMALGGRLLAEKPEVFIGRMEQFLTGWKRSAEAA